LSSAACTGCPTCRASPPTSAGGVGATGAFLIGVFTGRLDKEKISQFAAAGHPHRRRGILRS